MQAKWTVRILAIVVAIFAVFMLVPRQASVVTEAKVPSGWAFTLPEGDARAGHETFMRMQCYTCHTIDLVGNGLPPESGGIGPKLTFEYAQLPNEYLAESIIKAHSEVAAPDYQRKEGIGGMGNYNDFLTVKELTDLVAFLKARQELAVK
ncbi:c-type cytochrome [candidate division KSB1 bacterium]|nr:c-type cytochrome [candidate division KSB1 bacterium]